MKAGELPPAKQRSPRLFAAALAIVSTLATSHFVQAQESAPLSQWTRRDGQVFQAKFVRLQGTAIVVAKDGLEFAVPIAGLSPASLEQARRLAMRPLVSTSVAPRAIPVLPRAIPGVRMAPRATPVTPLAPVASFTFGPSVLMYCQDSVGRKIGNGQCADLAAQALKNAGAALRAGADSPEEGDYIWGDLVAWIKVGFFGARGVRELAHVEPGDIVQFHHTRFTGFDHTGAGIYRMEARHHTAVVESVDVSHATITVLHQNWNNHEIVRRQTLNIGGMTNGWLRFYHPIPRQG